MINIIIPIVDKVEEFSAFIQREQSKNVMFYVGIREGLKDKFALKQKNVELHIFKNSSNVEEIINSLHTAKMSKGKIMVARRPLTTEEFKNLVMSKSDIATLKARHGKLFSAIKRMLSYLIRRFFAFNFFEDISAICYGENMFELLSVCQNFSMATRLNKYVGVDIEEFETTEKQVKKQYNKPKALLLFALWSLLFAGSIAGVVLVGVFTKVRVLIVVILICWILVALMMWLAALLNFARTVSVGNVRYGRAEEIL